MTIRGGLVVLGLLAFSAASARAQMSMSGGGRSLGGYGASSIGSYYGGSGGYIPYMGNGSGFVPYRSGQGGGRASSPLVGSSLRRQSVVPRWRRHPSAGRRSPRWASVLAAGCRSVPHACSTPWFLIDVDTVTVGSSSAVIWGTRAFKLPCLWMPTTGFPSQAA